MRRATTSKYKKLTDIKRRARECGWIFKKTSQNEKGSEDDDSCCAKSAFFFRVFFQNIIWTPDIDGEYHP